MAKICIKVIDKAGTILAQAEAADAVNLLYKAEYNEGDKIVLNVEEINTYYAVRLDETRGTALVYLTGPMEYIIPFAEHRLSPLAFGGDRHIISVRKTFEQEWMNYRNLAENVWDQDEKGNCYPHASANVALPQRPLFWAKSVIDGLTFTEGHGGWPYSSWSVCKREDAAWKLEFGHSVEMDKLVIYSRADFPHDSWWPQMTVRFSDGSEEKLSLEKTGQAQMFSIQKEIQWLEICDLIKADDPSPFPALTQVQVYGRG